MIEGTDKTVGPFLVLFRIMKISRNKILVDKKS